MIYSKCLVLNLMQNIRKLDQEFKSTWFFCFPRNHQYLSSYFYKESLTERGS
jgi:hypothetical protein